MKRTVILLICLTTTICVYSQNIFSEGDQSNKPKVSIEQKKDAPIVQKQASQDNNVANATIDFESKVVDYGVIDYNSDGNREFVFTNNGTEPLIIKNAKGSCGCTVPTWPRDEISPGTTEKIKVKYSTNRVGKFTKTITLTTNASKKPVILSLKKRDYQDMNRNINPLIKPKDAIIIDNSTSSVEDQLEVIDNLIKSKLSDI